MFTYINDLEDTFCEYFECQSRQYAWNAHALLQIVRKIFGQKSCPCHNYDQNQHTAVLILCITIKI